MNEDLSIFEEIDESLKVEKLEKILANYGNFIIIVCIAIVLFVAFAGWWKNHVKEENAIKTSLLIQANELVEAKKYDEAIIKLQEVEKSSSDLAVIAKLRHAEILVIDKKAEQAIGLYKEISSGNGEKSLRDWAAINAEIISNNHNLPISLPKNATFAAFDSELNAINLINQNKNEDAKKVLESLSSKDTLPLPEKQRIAELLDYTKGTKQ